MLAPLASCTAFILAPSAISSGSTFGHSRSNRLRGRRFRFRLAGFQHSQSKLTLFGVIGLGMKAISTLLHGLDRRGRRFDNVDKRRWFCYRSFHRYQRFPEPGLLLLPAGALPRLRLVPETVRPFGFSLACALPLDFLSGEAIYALRLFFHLHDARNLAPIFARFACRLVLVEAFLPGLAANSAVLSPWALAFALN